MRAELFGSLRKAKKEKSSSRADRRSISCRSPTREIRLVSVHKARAQNVDDASIERFAENRRPLRSGDVKASVASDKSNPGSMIWIPGGSFLMGSNEFYREERPAHQETVQGFWIDPYPVTNGEFGKFVGATGYVTTCERPPDPAMYPDADPSLLVPGSSVFRKPRGPVDLRDNRAWWEYVPGGIGGIPRVPTAPSMVGMTTRSFTSPTRMRPHTQPGPERSCRSSPNGNSPPAAVSTARPTRGAKRLLRRGGSWPTFGRAGFPGRTSSSIATRAPLQSMPFPQTATGSTT